MAFERLNKGWPTAFQAFEQVGTAETHQAFTRFRKAGKLSSFRGSWLRFGMRDDIIGHTITWQVQLINRLHHPIRVEKSVGVIAYCTIRHPPNATLGLSRRGGGGVDAGTQSGGLCVWPLWPPVAALLPLASIDAYRVIASCTIRHPPLSTLGLSRRGGGGVDAGWGPLWPPAVALLALLPLPLAFASVDAYGVIASCTIDAKFDGTRRAYWKIGANAVGKGEIFLSCGGIGMGIVLLNKAAGAAYQREAHQLAPGIGILALLTGGQGADRALVNDMKLCLTQFVQQFLWANAPVFTLLI